MRTTLLRTLVVAGVLLVAACADGSTPLPTMPLFDHLLGHDEAVDVLESQLLALFPADLRSAKGPATKGPAMKGPPGKGKSAKIGKGGGVLRSALKRLRNIDRQVDRRLKAAQNQAMRLAETAMDLFNAGNLNTGRYPVGVFSSPDLDAEEALGEFIELLDIFVERTEGGFALAFVAPPPPGGETTVVTQDNNAGVTIDEGDLAEPTLISIQQIATENCLESDVIQSTGCWRFNKFPAGDFEQDVEVTICVDDSDILPSQIPFLRLHKFSGDEVTVLEATAGDSAVDCTEFVPLLVSRGSNSLRNFASAVSSGLRSLVGPQPLIASTAFAARRLGGLTGSFTDFGGALTFSESFESGVPADWTYTGTVGTSGTTANLAATDASEFGTMVTPGVDYLGFGGTGGSTWESSSFEALDGDVLSLDFNFLTTDGNGFNDFMFIQLINASTDAVVATIANGNTTGPVDQAVPALGAPAPLITGGTLSPTSAFFDGILTGPIGVCDPDEVLSGCTAGGQTFGPDKYPAFPLPEEPPPPASLGGSTGWVTSTFLIPADGDYKLSFVVQDLLNRVFPSGLAIDDIRLERPVL